MPSPCAIVGALKPTAHCRPGDSKPAGELRQATLKSVHFRANLTAEYPTRHVKPQTYKIGLCVKQFTTDVAAAVT